MPTERTSVLILRAWRESSPPRLRATIQHTQSVGDTAWHTEHLAAVPAIAVFVHAWLEQLAERTTDTHGPSAAEQVWTDEGGANGD